MNTCNFFIFNSVHPSFMWLVSLYYIIFCNINDRVTCFMHLHQHIYFANNCLSDLFWFSTVIFLLSHRFILDSEFITIFSLLIFCASILCFANPIKTLISTEIKMTARALSETTYQLGDKKIDFELTQVYY